MLAASVGSLPPSRNNHGVKSTLMHDFYVTYVHKTPCGIIVLSSCSTRESLTCSLLLSLRLRSRLSTINVSASSTSLNKEISRKLPWSQQFLKTQRLELWPRVLDGHPLRPPFVRISATGIQNIFKSIHLVLFVPVAATPFAFLLAQRSSRTRLPQRRLLMKALGDQRESSTVQNEG